MSLALLHRSLADRDRHPSPFLVLGDPTPAISLELARLAVAHGATMLELGIPYDDPCADGPAIQAADERARRAGMNTDRAFEMMGQLRHTLPEVPFNLLVYGNLVHARGYRHFCRDAVAAGASSLLVPDIPVEEGEPLHDACRAADLGIVQLVAPLTSEERLARLAEISDAFLYLAANQAVTGKSKRRPEGRTDLVRRIAARIQRPLCVGFGLSRPQHLHEAFGAGAQIAVVGSHLARVIEAAWDESAPAPRVVQQSFVDAWQSLLASPPTPVFENEFKEM